MTKERKGLAEAGRLIVEASSDGAPVKYKAALITQGLGSSGYYPPEFFTAANAQALANSLSFPGHPEDSWRPDLRDPMSAIGWIGDDVTIEQDAQGQWGFYATYFVSESKPEVAPYLAEFGKRLGLSIYIEGEGEYDPATDNWIVTSIDGNDPYKSVDVVVAAGRGGALLQAEAALRRLESQTSAPAAETKKEKVKMNEDEVKALVKAEIAEALTPVTTAITALTEAVKPVEKVEGEGAEPTVEAKMDKYAADLDLINEAGLTETQAVEAKALAKEGGDVQKYVDNAKKVVAEARKGLSEGYQPRGMVVNHVGGSTTTEGVTFGVSDFGKVR